jgi:hypothetical protein
MRSLPKGSRARVLLSSVFKPFAQDDKYGSRAINPIELYHNQVTREQGPFSLRMSHRSAAVLAAGVYEASFWLIACHRYATLADASSACVPLLRHDSPGMWRCPRTSAVSASMNNGCEFSAGGR